LVASEEDLRRRISHIEEIILKLERKPESQCDMRMSGPMALNLSRMSYSMQMDVHLLGLS